MLQYFLSSKQQDGEEDDAESDDLESVGEISEEDELEEEGHDDAGGVAGEGDHVRLLHLQGEDGEDLVQGARHAHQQRAPPGHTLRVLSITDLLLNLSNPQPGTQ